MSGSRSFYKKRNARIFQVGQTLVQSQLNWHYDNDNGSFPVSMVLTFNKY